MQFLAIYHLWRYRQGIAPGESVEVRHSSLVSITWKRCKIGGKLLLMTNKKSHMGFRLVPNSVTLNDLERHNNPNDCLISSNSVAFWADYIKVVEDTRTLSKEEM